MSGPELQVVRQRLQPLQRSKKRAGTSRFGPDHSGRGLQQVGAAHVANEDEVARHHRDRFWASRTIDDNEREVFRRVAGSVHHVQADLAEPDHVTVMQQYRVVGGRKGILPIGAALTRQERTGAGRGSQLTGAGHEVGVNVCFRHLGDPDALVSRRVEIRCDVARGIDHDGLTGLLAADEVARLREAIVVKPANQHSGHEFLSDREYREQHEEHGERAGERRG